jgi:hypothetical protein
LGVFRSLARLEDRLALHGGAVVFAAIGIGLTARLGIGATTTVNPDEAWQALLSNPPTLAGIYRRAIAATHPPGLIYIIHALRQISDSDLALRLVPIVAGAIFPYFLYRWLSLVHGKCAGIVAALVLIFAPNLVALSAQARGYTVALLFTSAALYYLERAIREGDLRWMGLFAVSLYLGIFTEYSTAWFTAAAGLYFALRIREPGVTARLRVAWLLTQAGAACFYAFLYFTQITYLQAEAKRPDSFLGTWYLALYPSGDFHPIEYLLRATFWQFEYLFSSLYLGLAAFGLFAVGLLTLLWKAVLLRARPLLALAVLITSPFLIAAAGAFAHIYPYAKSRHTVFLAIFIATGVALGVDFLCRSRMVASLLLAGTLVLAWQWIALPDPHNMPRERQRREFLVEALRYLRSEIPPGSLILMEDETRLILKYYLDGRGWPPKLERRHELIAGYRMVAMRFSFSGVNDLVEDIETVRREYGLAPEEPVWVADGGFYSALYHALVEYPNLGLALRKVRVFGDGIVIAQAPPGFEAAVRSRK